MKALFFLTASLVFCVTAFSQANVDSVKEKISNSQERINNSRVVATLDSIPTELPQLPDSLLPSFQKVDSIRQSFNDEAGKIKNEYDQAVGNLNGAQHKIQSKIDSLEQLKLPTEKYTRQLDSLNQVRTSTVSKFNGKIEALKSKTTGKLNALDLPPQYQEPIKALTKNVDAISLSGDAMKIPGIEMPGFKLPDLKGVDVPNMNTGDLTSKLGDVGKLGSLPKIETPVGDLGQVGEQVKGYGDDVKNIANGKVGDVQHLDKTIENQATKIDGVSELQKQSGVIDEYKSQLDMVKDPSSGKDKVVEVAKQAAIDHFAGKEEQLKAAMDQMSKYKQKYSSVSSLKDLPKRPPNAMKGKPFIERLVPGFYFQFQQKYYNLYDVNPYLGYRISGRFTAGGGWNQRFAYDRRRNEWQPKARIYGPRAYVDFKMGKGFIAHLESEMMNTFVPSRLNNPVFDDGHREWVWGMMTGMKRDYTIYKNLRGTVLIQYNIFNPKYKAPYVDRLNSRIGFEYKLSAKKKSS